METIDIDTIRNWATNRGAYTLQDRDGDVAVVARLFDEDGLEIVQSAPDPVEFRPQAYWLAKINSRP